MAKGKKNKNSLFNPGKVLTGKQLQNAAAAATKIEYNPVISAHKRELAQIARQRKRDDQGLARLGRRTTREMHRRYSGTNQILKDAIGAAGQTGQQLMDASAANQGAAQTRMEGLQTGLMGAQLAGLSSQNIPEGGSASQNALAQAIASRNLGASDNALAFGNAAAKGAAGMADAAQGRLDANRLARNEAVTSVKTATGSRRMDSRAAYADAQKEVRGSLRNARSLKGATKLNNIMRLRDSERGFANERAAIMQDAKEAAQDYALGLKEEQGRNNRDDGDGGSGSGSEGTNDHFDYNFNQLRRAADQVRNGVTIRNGAWNEFLNQVEKDKDFIEWSPAQRDRFLKQYKKYLEKKG